MGDWPLLGAQYADTVGETAATSLGTLLTASATANTKGSYTEVVASTSTPVHGLVVALFRVSGGGRDFLVDVAVGNAGSETIIAADLIISIGATAPVGLGWLYPVLVAVPAGSRIAARCQCTTGSSTVNIIVVGLTQGFLPSSPLGLVSTHGANTADSGGTQVDPGGTANTKGAYSQLVAATTYPIVAFALGIGCIANTAMASASWLVDIAVGAASSEQVVVADLPLSSQANGAWFTPPVQGIFPISIPAGSRIAARAQCSSTDATDRLFDLVLYGFS